MLSDKHLIPNSKSQLSIYQITLISDFDIKMNKSQTQKQNWPNLLFHLKWFHYPLKEDLKGIWLRELLCWPYHCEERFFKKIFFFLPLPLMMPSCYLAMPLRDAPASQALKLVALFQARFALRLWVIAKAVLHFNRWYNLQVPIFPNTKTLISP